MATDVKVQRGSSTIATSSSSVTITAGVDYTAPSAASKAFCRITATKNLTTVTADGTVDEATAYASVSQTDITASVTFTRSNSSATRAVRVDWEIIEYIGADGGPNEFVVRAVGEIALGAATAESVTTGAISGIVTDADVVPWITGVRCDSPNFAPRNASFTSSWNSGADTATFTRVRQHNTNATIGYAIVEFTGSAWSVQSVEHTFVAADTNETETITSVGAPTQAFMHLQCRHGDSVLDDASYQAWISSATQATFYAPVGFSGTFIVKGWIIANAGMTVARYNDATGTGAGTFTKTVTTVVLEDTSVDEVSGSIAQATASMPGEILSFRLTDTTTVTGYRNRALAAHNYRFATIVWPTAAAGLTIATPVSIRNTAGPGRPFSLTQSVGNGKRMVITQG